MPRTKKSEPKKTKTKRIVKKVEKGLKEVEEKAGEAVEQLGEEVGKITHYFDQIGVAVVDLIKELKVGDMIRVKGMTTDFTQPVESMQIEHEKVKKAGKGKAIGLKVKEKVRGSDKVYIVKE